MPSGQPQIVCAIASDEVAESVVATARRLAGNGYRVHFLHAADVPSRTAPVYAAGAMGAPAYSRGLMVSEFTEAGKRLLERLGVDEDTAEVVPGDPAGELQAKAEAVGAEFIVVGGRGHGPLSGAILGSVARTLANEGRWPLMLVRDSGDRAPRGPVVCGVAAPSEDAVRVARMAERLAHRIQTPLLLAHVPDDSDSGGAVDAGGFPSAPGAVLPATSSRGSRDPRSSALLDEVVGQLEGGIEVRTALLAGTPASALAALAGEVDAEAVVVGRRGLGAVRSAIQGSVSTDLMRDAGCPVMVVPASAGVTAG